jgi:hypothetical protein
LSQQLFIYKEKVHHCEFLLLSSDFFILFFVFIKSDVQAFTTEHSVKQAIENINSIRSKLNEVLPGGDKIIKSISLKSTDSLSVPIYVNLGK